jgi:deoxycytidylate deaminase
MSSTFDLYNCSSGSDNSSSSRQCLREDRRLLKRQTELKSLLSSLDCTAQHRLKRELAGKNRRLGRALLQCQQCLYICAGIGRMRNHLVHHHGHDRSGTIFHHVLSLEWGLQFYTCSICALEFERGVQLGKHLEHAHGMHDVIIINPDYICSNSLPHTDDASLIATAEPEMKPSQTAAASKNHPCKMCSKKFTTAGILKYHTQVIHERRFSAQCDICGKIFATGNRLRKHIDGVHRNIKPFQCRICRAVFSTNTVLHKHTNKIHYSVQSLEQPLGEDLSLSQ